MILRKLELCIVMAFVMPIVSLAQSPSLTIKGKVLSDKDPVVLATVVVKETNTRAFTNIDGEFYITLDEKGVYTLYISASGYRNSTQTINLSQEENSFEFTLTKDALGLDQVVVSATRNRVERKKAPVVISSISTRLLNATQSTTLADGLSYAPGVRVENNCQNCGFTQVRLNGLQGAYTQILLNSRPVFTSLLGVYGLEQIPVNTIDRIEVVRSGGSALYGSNAIAGTVNVITKDPVLNTWEIGSTISSIKGEALDRNLNFNSSMVADDLQTGVTLYGSYRNRDAYDANDDGFTELVEIDNTTVGAKAFLKSHERSRISLNLNAIKEYRRGGNRLDLAPQFTDITEELQHDTFIGGADYEWESTDYSHKLQAYTSTSYTNRDSYYGGLGGSRTRQDSLIANNAFGTTKDLAWVTGVQHTKSFTRDVITTGLEYVTTNTEDEIPGYNRSIDQQVNTIGFYSQYEWKPTEKVTALLGARFDHVNVDGKYSVGTVLREVSIDQTAISPRLTMSYDLTKQIKLRAGYARGFRAPQAFNEDLHISSVGGEQLFVILSEDLKTEYSNAFTSSFNYSLSKNLLQLDFLVEGFYTTIQDPFTQVSTGATLNNGSILEEVRNGSGATVFGSNIEIGVSPSSDWRFQIGATYQKSRYDDEQLLFESDGTLGESDIFIDEFVRNPNWYGFLNATWLPSEKFNIDLTSTYTGRMNVPRVVSDSGFLQINRSNPFLDMNLKVETHFDYSDDFMITISGGVRNMFDSFQDDFDTGATRDSDYVYGPMAPRTVFLGIKIGKMH
ncbi:TonB-dependent receptor [Nonlabens sp. MIC269]|nr:TonB-dependent receptor [Nonlabens sp. MIC269]